MEYFTRIRYDGREYQESERLNVFKTFGRNEFKNTIICVVLPDITQYVMYSFPKN